MKHDSKIVLALKALIKYLLGGAVVALLLFLPAGSIYYLGAWRLLSLLFGPMFLMGTYMLFASPELLKRRLSSGEKRAAQGGVIKLSGVVFIVGFVVAALDWRYGWSMMSSRAVTIGCMLFLVGYGLYFEVMRENVWLSRRVEVAEGQKVIQTGLYGVVRHPMYFATLLMFLAIPLVLGSWWAVCAFAFYVPLIVVRTIDEEKLLKAELEGYDAYCRKVKWRLLPLVW